MKVILYNDHDDLVDGGRNALSFIKNLFGNPTSALNLGVSEPLRRFPNKFQGDHYILYPSPNRFSIRFKGGDYILHIQSQLKCSDPPKNVSQNLASKE